MNREERNAWLATLTEGSAVRVAEYNGAPESAWLERRVEYLSPTDVDGPRFVVAVVLNDGARFAQDDGRQLIIVDGRRVYLGMNERLEPPAGYTP